MRMQALFRRMDDCELRWCEWLNRGCRARTVRKFFAVVSRLGDGVFWYVLIGLLPVLFGREALLVSLHMGLVGLAGLLIYKILKSHLIRERPYMMRGSITLGTAPLDQYSFPSGHTLHAVSFSLVALFYYPVLAWVVIPFAISVALSRVVLGLHYPTDVAAGAGLGGLLAYTSFLLIA